MSNHNHNRGGWNGTSDGSKHRGNWHIQNGVEITPEVAMAVIDAVASASTIKAALSKSGRGPDVEGVKGLIKTALFSASMTERHIHWVNSQIHDTGKPHSNPHHRDKPTQSPHRSAERDFDDFDFD